MRKFICAVILGCVCLSVAACGGNKEDVTGSTSTVEEVAKEPFITGTWELTSIVLDGSTYTMEEVLAMGDESMKDTYFVLKDGGNSVMYSAGTTANVEWSLDVTAITIGVQTGEYDGETIILALDNGNQLILTKYSDDQNFVFKAEETEQEAEPVETSSSEASSSGVELREFADTYEAFMNEYVEFMKKYKDNPTDTRLIGDYGAIMEKYVDFTQKAAEVKEAEYSTEDYKYYLEVLNRCNQKLVEVM